MDHEERLRYRLAIGVASAGSVPASAKLGRPTPRKPGSKSRSRGGLVPGLKTRWTRAKRPRSGFA
jgi:hypothetical protein